MEIAIRGSVYAGHLICYQRDRSLGLFQKMRTDNMHVGVMFANALSGTGGKMMFDFDENFNSSSITNLRNQHIPPNSPLAEALYEGLCLFRKSQGPCYNNSGASRWGTPRGHGVAGDPFYFTHSGEFALLQELCAHGQSRGGYQRRPAPDLQSPFGNLFTGTNIGVVSAGRRRPARRCGILRADARHREQASPTSGEHRTSRFTPSTRWEDRRGILASASKYGGFEDRNKRERRPDGAILYLPCWVESGERDGHQQPRMGCRQNCMPDTFFDASQDSDLEAQINLAISSILKKSASGTSISVLASSSTGEGSIYQAFFYPSTFEGTNEIKWTGFVQGLFVDTYGNLREDRGGSGGAADGRLVYTDDNIVQTRLDAASGDVKVDRFVDAEETGKQIAPLLMRRLGFATCKAFGRQERSWHCET